MSNNNKSAPTSGVYKAMYPFLTGGLSATMATCCVQPIDMVKVRIQIMEGAGGSTNPFKVASGLIKSDGFLGLYKGLSAAVLRQLTYGMTRLGVFQTLQKKTAPTDGSAPTFLTRVGCSLAAGGIGALVGTPADAALVRMQSDATLPEAERRGYKNAIDALMRMAREEGLRGFFSGASPTVYRGLSINVGMLASYDYYKRFMIPLVGDGKASHWSAGFLSGWTAATVSLPFDFLKTRLQRQARRADGTYQYKNFLDCAKQTVTKEGPLKLYQGYLTYCFRITPHIMLTWVFLEIVKGVDVLKPN